DGSWRSGNGKRERGKGPPPTPRPRFATAAAAWSSPASSRPTCTSVRRCSAGSPTTCGSRTGWCAASGRSRPPTPKKPFTGPPCSAPRSCCSAAPRPSSTWRRCGTPARRSRRSSGSASGRRWASAYSESVGIAGPRVALAHCGWVDAHETARLARQGTTVVHCPSSNLKLASGVAKVPELLAAGCHVAIGADGAPCNNRLDVFAEMRLAALIQKPRLGADALPAGRVLELATLGGARALGLEAEIGSIAPGKRADLVVLDLREPHLHPAMCDPVSLVVYAACASDVRDVFVDGKPVVLGHELLTAPIDEIVREADRSAAELHRMVSP